MIAQRDPLGHASVYYARQDGELLVEPEIAPLLARLRTRPAPDPVAVAGWLQRTGIPEDRTLYTGVRRLLPGRRLLADGTVQRWWSARRDVGTVTDKAEAVALLGEAMADAVARAGGDGLLLSGGFDSGAIAALAPGLPTYSMTFPGVPEADEAIPPGGHVTAFAGGSAVAAAEEFVAFHGMPPVSPNGFVWRPLVRAAAADGVTRLLDGEGGDELLGVPPFVVADAWLPAARGLPGMGADPRPVWLLRALAKYGLRARLPAALHEPLRRRPATWVRHPVRDERWAWKAEPGPRWRAALVHALTDGADRLGAPEHLRREAQLCGLAFGHPWRDPQLLDAVLRIDPRLQLDPHRDRPLARDAIGLHGTRKATYNALLRDALWGVDAPRVRALLGPGARVGAYLDLAAVAAALDAGRPSPGLDLDLWRALTLELWLRAQ